MCNLPYFHKVVCLQSFLLAVQIVALKILAHLSALVIIGYFLAMKFAGFLISTVLLLVILFLLQGVKGPLKVAITSLSVTAGIYVFFLYVMKVHFPMGSIFD